MAGPWEKFQTAEAPAAEGPWAKFAKPVSPVQDRMAAVPEPTWIERQVLPNIFGLNPQGKTLSRQIAELPDLISPMSENRIRGAVMGAADPSVGLAQLAANLVPGSKSLSSLVTGKDDSVGGLVNQAIKQKEQQYEQGRQAAGREGFDAMRFAGNVASPMNLILASRLPAATTTAGRAGVGALAGGAGGLATPVVDGGGDFSAQKATQAGLGALTGGALSPVLGKVGDMIAKRALTGPKASMRTDEIIQEGMDKLGVQAQDITAPQMTQLRQQVMASLEKGKKLDVPAVIRSQDFEKLGIQPTLGQVTRDPTQFAREKNLRGIAGVGEPLMQRFEQQNQGMQQAIDRLRGNPSEAYPAGKMISETLQSYDEGLRKNVGALYQQARESAGKDVEIPMGGLANDYATVLDDFADKVPSGVRNQFKKFGLEGEQQTKLFTVESADKLLKSINDHVGSDKATNTALGRLRDAVKRSVVEDAGIVDVFSPARKAAAERFKLQDAVPALKAAATGDTTPDDFVKKFVLNGKVEDVKGLADVLSKTNPEAFNQARAQVGDKIMRSAFGENLSGDKLPAPERLAKVLREIGTEKLQAFYSPEEIAQLNRAARVSAYMHSIPSGAPVNTSNTAAAAFNLLGRIPGVPMGIGLLNTVKNAATNSAAVNAAMRAAPGSVASDISPAQAEYLSRILNRGALASGGTAGLLATGQE